MEETTFNSTLHSALRNSRLRNLRAYGGSLIKLENWNKNWQFFFLPMWVSFLSIPCHFWDPQLMGIIEWKYQLGHFWWRKNHRLLSLSFPHFFNQSTKQFSFGGIFVIKKINLHFSLNFRVSFVWAFFFLKKANIMYLFSLSNHLKKIFIYHFYTFSLTQSLFNNSVFGLKIYNNL